MLFENTTDYYKSNETNVFVDSDFLKKFKQLLEQSEDQNGDIVDRSHDTGVAYLFTEDQTLDIHLEIERLLEELEKE